MKDRHVTDLISPYLDGALSERERRRVDAHAAKCAECRKELAELECVQRLVASLPEEELPGGFLQRLAARRRREAGASPRSLPAVFPARSLALGLTGVLACLFFFREIKYRLAPAMLPGMASADSLMDAEMEKDFGYAAPKAPPGGGASAWSGVVEENAAASAGKQASTPPPAEETSQVNRETLAMLRAAEAGKPLPRRKASPAARGAKASAGGPTNESLRGFLDVESRKMGIREVLPPQPKDAAQAGQQDDAWGAIPNRPMNREEAQAAMKQMTQNLYQINQQAGWKRAPTVPLTGRTPRIIAKEAGGGALNQPEPVPAPSESLGARSVAFAKAAARAPSAPVGALSDRAVSAPQMGVVRAAGAGAALPESKTETPLEPRALDWTREWSAASGGMPASGGALIKKPEDWADMHRRVSFAPELPPFDAKEEMAVAVFGEPSETQSRRLRIVSVTEENGRLLIRYRTSVSAEGAPLPSAPYHIVIVPRSDLAFSFIQVP